MQLSPDPCTFHLIRAFEIVPVCRFIKPALLTAALTRPFTFRPGTKALPVARSRVRGIQLSAMQTFTMSSFFHKPQNLREEKTRSKENPPARRGESKKMKKSIKRNVLNKNQPTPSWEFQTGQITPLSFQC
jgi:hypothetical protein